MGGRAQPAGHEPQGSAVEHARHVGSHPHLHHRAVRRRVRHRCAARARARAALPHHGAQGRAATAFPANRYGNIWGRKFYKSCGQLPESVRGQCGEGKAYQVNDAGLDRVGRRRQQLARWHHEEPLADEAPRGEQSPWNYPLFFGHPIIDRPLRGQPGEGVGTTQIIGNVLPDFRFTYSNNMHVQAPQRSTRCSMARSATRSTTRAKAGAARLQLRALRPGAAGRSRRRSRSATAGALAVPRPAPGTGGFYDILGSEQLQHRRRLVREAARSEPDAISRSPCAASVTWTRRPHRAQPVHVHELQRATIRKSASTGWHDERVRRPDQPGRRVRIPDAAVSSRSRSPRASRSRLR